MELHADEPVELGERLEEYCHRHSTDSLRKP